MTKFIVTVRSVSGDAFGGELGPSAISRRSRTFPLSMAGLQWIELTDKAGACTIRAETEGFVPISECKSIYNTDKTPFDKYDPGTPIGLKLGNTEPRRRRKIQGTRFRPTDGPG